jgi:hypothetical protein
MRSSTMPTLVLGLGVFVGNRITFRDKLELGIRFLMPSQWIIRKKVRS